MVAQLSRYLSGWRGYFGFCETPSVLQSLDQWLRRRLRSVVWKQWKYARVRFAELRKRGVGKDLAAQTAGSAHAVATQQLSGSQLCTAQCLLGVARSPEVGRGLT